MACRGICSRYKGQRRYGNPPNKKCRRCDMFIDTTKWQSSNCPCCGNKLSGIPNKSKYRIQLRNERGTGKEIA